MADRRMKIMDVPVNPAMMPGLVLLADSITGDDGAVITITFPAKHIFAVLATTTGTSVASAHSVSSGVGTITLTLTGNGTVDFIALASITETIGALDIGTEATYSLTPTV